MSLSIVISLKLTLLGLANMSEGWLYTNRESSIFNYLNLGDILVADALWSVSKP